MSMQIYYDIKKMLCEELDKMADKGRIANREDLSIIDALTHSIKSVETIIAMNESKYEGKSEHYLPPHMWGPRSFDDGQSNGQRRNAMGQFSRDNYENGSMMRSRDEGMVEELRDLMYRAKDDQTRMKFKRFIMDLEER